MEVTCAVEQLITRLSREYGEAQAFATHRIIEYHHWMLARDGSLLRSFAYLGESGETLANRGELTPIEEAEGWFTATGEDRFPSEENVLQVAEAWSIDPISLDPTDPCEGEGLLGKAPGPLA